MLPFLQSMLGANSTKCVDILARYHCPDNHGDIDIPSGARI